MADVQRNSPNGAEGKVIWRRLLRIAVCRYFEQTNL
jgi:hypothetical protein